MPWVPNQHGGTLQRLTAALEGFHAHCREMFLAIDHLQRAWGQLPNLEDMVVSMYRYLYEIYPPKFIQILESTLDEAEAESRGKPTLR